MPHYYPERQDNNTLPWYLQENALQLLEQRIANGVIDTSEKKLFIDLINNGFCIIRNAVPAEVIDQINEDVEAVPQNRDKVVVRRLAIYQPVTVEGLGHPNDRLLDFYIPSKAALDATLADPITNILTKLYDEPPMAFQSLLFRYGSEQALHQDTAYVVNDKPHYLTASWVALEDIQPGTGELCYYSGSHLQKNQCWQDNQKIWSLTKDHIMPNSEFLVLLEEQCKKQGLEFQAFLPKKGDVLIWLAELAHGGSPITQPGATRKSYVTHYCPASDSPNFFAVNHETAVKVPYKNGVYSTRHYDARPESNNPYPTYYGGENLVEIRDRTTPKKLANIFLPNFNSGLSQQIMAMLEASPDIYLTKDDLGETFDSNWAEGLKIIRDEFFEHCENTIWRMPRGLLPISNHPGKLLGHIRNTFQQATRIIVVLNNPLIRAYGHCLRDFSSSHKLDLNKLYDNYLTPFPYAPTVREMIEVFGKHRCLFLIEEEDLLPDPKIGGNKIADFLHIDRFELPELPRSMPYAPRYWISPEDQQVVLKLKNRGIPLPPGTPVFFTSEDDSTCVLKPLPSNEQQRIQTICDNLDVVSLQPEELACLIEELAGDDIRELESILGRKLDCWLNPPSAFKLEQAPEPEWYKC